MGVNECNIQRAVSTMPVVAMVDSVNGNTNACTPNR